MNKKIKTFFIGFLLGFSIMSMANGQSVNDSRDAKEEIRKERMEQYQMQQDKMWKQKDHNRKVGVEEMILKMKMHDRKIYQEHMKKHHSRNLSYDKNFNKKNHKPQMHSDKKRRIIGGIVIFSLGYIVGVDDDHRGKKHHKKEKDFRGDR
jgi:hypothetical protein